MKIDKPENCGYSATVVSLKQIIKLENCDSVSGTPIFGYQAIVSNDYKVGDMGIVFLAETQLSEEFCAKNNLFRHSELNDDKTQKGYIEDNRRVKAMKFRGQTSNCFFMPLSSLEYTGVNISLLKEGDEFDTLNGKEICRKYVVKTNTPRDRKEQEKKFSRVDQKHLPEHTDTLQFLKYADTIDKDSECVVTQKIHGTSIRIGHVPVLRKLNLAEKILSKLGVSIEKYEYDYVYGSRKVIKDSNNPDQVHFYDNDIWSEQGSKLKGLLPENYIVYGELVGWTSDGKEIQKNYTYGIEHEESELYIYRIAIVNQSGFVTDLSWDQVKIFCGNNGLKYVPELWKGETEELLEEIDGTPLIKSFLDIRYHDGEMKKRQALWLGENKDIVDEGVCVRIEGINPRIYKCKSPIFLLHETKILDEGKEDLESSQN